MDLLNWIFENWESIGHALTAIVTAASCIAALTPTPKDDPIAKAAYSILDTLALNIGKAKDK